MKPIPTTTSTNIDRNVLEEIHSAIEGHIGVKVEPYLIEQIIRALEDLGYVELEQKQKDQ